MNRITITAAMAFLLASPFATADTYKVIDSNGNTVIPPIYDSISTDDNGTFELTKRGASDRKRASAEIIHVDFNGKPVAQVNRGTEKKIDPTLPPGYSISHEQDGYLYVLGPKGSGVFSRSGHEIVPAENMDVSYVGDQMFTSRKFEAGTLKHYLFDDAGKIVCELPQWARPEGRHFHSGLLHISDDSPKFIDKQGNLKTIGTYSDIQDFFDGLAVAVYREGNDWFSGYIDPSGKMVIGPFENCICSPFVKGAALIRQRGSDDTETVGVLARTGKFAIPIGKYESITESTDGDWLVTSHGQFSLLQRDGRIVCKFPEKCKSVHVGSKLTSDAWIPCGFGEIADKNQADKLLWGYCDLSGNVCLQPKYSRCDEFVDELAVAAVNSADGKQVCGVINRRGDFVLPPRHNWIEIASSNRFIVSAEPSEERKQTFKDANWEQRREIFSTLLRDHNLIAMSKTELQNILGMPDSAGEADKNVDATLYYSLSPGARCGNAASGIEFRLNKKEQILGWRFAPFCSGGAHSWVTENVFLQDPKWPLTLGNFVPKENP